MMSPRRLFIFLYMASGAAALVYEVAWTRLLTLQMGHTVSAVSTVLAAFMGGLSGGAWIGGRIAVGRVRALRTYAAIETVIALAAVALPAMLAATFPIVRWAYADGDAPARFAFVRAALSFALLAIPAAAMGATFPIAASWFAETRARVQPDARPRSSADVGVLYAANTAGAAIGAVLAGFWLIPGAGLRGTTWIGVGLNAVAAIGALWLSRRAAIASPLPVVQPDVMRSSKPKSKAQRRRVQSIAAAAPAPALAWSAAALSGFAALVYEVAFTRLLALVIGPTTYAFATMAASFISGIAVGSAIGARLSRRVAQPALWLAAAIGIMAISASLAASFAASQLPLRVASEVAAADATFRSVVVRQAFEVALLMLPMTVALGAAFTLALAVAESGVESVGRYTAGVYVSNTLGAIAGSLAAGFVLVPGVGLAATFTLTSLVAIAGAVTIAAWATMRTAPRKRRLYLLGGLIGAGAVAAIVADIREWDRRLLSSGAYKYAPYIRAGDAAAFEASLRAGRLEYYKEGAAGTVSVRRLHGKLSLAIDGKVDASNAGDMLTQRLLGALPVLLHPDPKELCVIGLGSGVTVSSAMATGLVRHADVVEISPEVVDASAFFSNENGDVLHAPAVRVVLGDGRSHLRLTTRTYDVIVSEPSNPWMSGVAALFTREFFEAARARLLPDGIVCQWAHTYDMSDTDLRSIVHTFASIFPQSTMWRVGDGDLLLIGTTGRDIEARLAFIQQRSRTTAMIGGLADVGIVPPTAAFNLLSLFAGGPAEIKGYGDAAAIQTDDRTALEFTAPGAIYGRFTNANAATIGALTKESRLPAAVAEAMHTADARSWAARGAMDLKAEAYLSAYENFRRAFALDPGNADILRSATNAAAGANQQDQHRTWLEDRAKAAPANAVLRVELSHVRAAAGDFDGAVAAAAEAQRIDPNDPRPAEQLASVFADMGDAQRLVPLADLLVARYPDRDEGHYYQATALMLRDQPADAATVARRLVAASPSSAKAQNLLGAACASTGQKDCAEAAFTTSIRLDPRDPSSYTNLGLLYLQTGRPEEAADSFGEALALDPSSTAARDGLRQAREAQGTR
jgi:spermidine synthase